MARAKIKKIEYEYRRSNKERRFRVTWDGDVYGMYGTYETYTHVDAIDEMDAYIKALEWQNRWKHNNG